MFRIAAAAGRHLRLSSCLLLIHSYSSLAVRQRADEEIRRAVTSHEVSALNATDAAEFLKDTPWDGLVENRQLLSKGAYGRAYSYDLVGCDSKVVIKEIFNCENFGLVQMSFLMFELYLMTRLKSQNVIKAFGFYPLSPMEWCSKTEDGQDKSLKILMEYAKGGEILESFKNKIDEVHPYSSSPWMIVEKLSSGGVKEKRHEMKVKLLSMMLVRTLRGLADLHAFGWIHADLKPQNIWSTTPEEDAGTCLERETCDWVLGDLGLAISPTVGSRKLKLEIWAVKKDIPCVPTHGGSRLYMPPEAKGPQVGGKEVPGHKCGTAHNFWTFQGDVYALAMSLNKVADEAAGKSYVPELLTDLLRSMMAADLQQRPTAAEALERAEAYYKDQFGHPLGPSPAATGTSCVVQALGRSDAWAKHKVAQDAMMDKLAAKWDMTNTVAASAATLAEEGPSIARIEEQ
eukprot:TRINITY_DN29550_c0_g1_i1.p1 TRINITY_DN29550_c0_g1~~TRINITY_DN29550_c0_g1_i1.p1  ORF type:complete len:458 (+),score=107.94 TRINITY_DN29550_c0_g1_i1:192-1565(+)